MTERYAIADHLPIEARRAAVAAEYRGTVRRTVDGCCPLGVAFRSVVPDANPLPYGKEAAALIRFTFGGGGGPEPVLAVDEFILDWDCGLIHTADLAVALDVTP